MADGDDGGVRSPPLSQQVPNPYFEDPTTRTKAEVAVLAEQLRREIAALEDGLRREIDNRVDILVTRFEGIDQATDLRIDTIVEMPILLRVEIREAIGHLQALLESRINAMDKATELLAANLREVPTDIDKANRALREVLQGEIRNVQDVAIEKFLAIDGTFSSNALALTAALAAQKEAAAEQNKSNTLAITKSEQATKETIASNAQQTATSLKSLADRLDDLKERVDRGEGQGQGETAATIEARAVAAAQLAAANHQQGAAANRISANALIATAIGLMITVGGIIIAVILARH